MELENKLWKNSIYNELGGRTCKEVINVPFQELRAELCKVGSNTCDYI